MRDQLADWIGGCSVADETEGFGRAALNERRRIGKRRNQGIARGFVADEAERESGHLPHLGLGIGEGLEERSDALAQSDATDRERSAAPDACLCIAQQRHQVWLGRRRHDRRRFFPARRRRRRDHRRRRISKHPLVLETENPRHLLIGRRACRLRRRGRRAGAGRPQSHTEHGEDQPQRHRDTEII